MPIESIPNLEEQRRRDHCIRCGECCLKSSPTLQVQDLPIIVKGIIEKTNLYTIRKGELVRDNINDSLMVTRKEMIKVKERDEGRKGCMYYDEAGKACKIYDQRPDIVAATPATDAVRPVKHGSDEAVEQVNRSGTREEVVRRRR